MDINPYLDYYGPNYDKLKCDSNTCKKESTESTILMFAAYALVIVGLILLILAIYWEYQDHDRLKDRPDIDEIDEEDRLNEYLFYGCFNAENRVSWRNIYIASFISVLLIWYILIIFNFAPRMTLTLCNSGGRPSLNILILIFITIFCIFYIVDQFREYHLYRDMCAKIRTDKCIL